MHIWATAIKDFLQIIIRQYNRRLIDHLSMLLLGCSGAPWSSCVGDISSHSWAVVEEGSPWASCSALPLWWLGRSPSSLTFCHKWYLRGARRFASRWCYPWRWFQKTQTLQETHRNRPIISRFWSPMDSVAVLNVDGAKAAVGDGCDFLDRRWLLDKKRYPLTRAESYKEGLMILILFVSTDSFMMSATAERFSERKSRVNSSSIIRNPHQPVLSSWLLAPASGVLIHLCWLGWIKSKAWGVSATAFPGPTRCCGLWLNQWLTPSMTLLLGSEGLGRGLVGVSPLLELILYPRGAILFRVIPCSDSWPPWCELLCSASRLTFWRKVRRLRQKTWGFFVWSPCSLLKSSLKLTWLPFFSHCCIMSKLLTFLNKRFRKGPVHILSEEGLRISYSILFFFPCPVMGPSSI